ncbi:MAG: polysulfide reductase NrfD [Candidatus Heimdallarchaeota archaeon]|nr:polysulfide reductase NrfD [Candidatus Heimdallarchaeota archaeon]
MTSKYDIEQDLLHPVFTSGRNYFILVATCTSIIIAGTVAWIYQLVKGLGVTGLSQRIFWGIYISNFIFFMGISYSGTIISAILRILDVKWKTPVTRTAEAVTFIGGFVGFFMIIIDMGRPERLLLVAYASRIQSPLFWDMLSVGAYLFGSFIFFYLPLIPDLALMRDHHEKMRGGKLRIKLYQLLSVGYQGTTVQKEALDKAIKFINIIMIPVAIICSTIFAFIFAMTWRVGWHSTIFGPAFVVASVFSGTAAIIISLMIIRKLYNLEKYLTKAHFRNMAIILFISDGGYLYFTVTEYFTTIYRAAKHDMELTMEEFFGRYALFFWFFIFIGMVIPGLMLFVSILKWESDKAIPTIFTASVFVLLGMWVKRYLIVIPALARPFVEQAWTPYTVSLVEWAVTFAGIAGFVLIFAMFTKVFPIISVWELQEDQENNII